MFVILNDNEALIVGRCVILLSNWTGKNTAVNNMTCESDFQFTAGYGDVSCLKYALFKDLIIHWMFSLEIDDRSPVSGFRICLKPQEYGSLRKWAYYYVKLHTKLNTITNRLLYSLSKRHQKPASCAPCLIIRRLRRSESCAFWAVINRRTLPHSVIT